MTLTLDPHLVLSGYVQGVFPMGEEDEDGQPCISWYAPDPRGVIFLDEFKTTRSLRQRVKSKQYEVIPNQAFESVMHACADRPEGTWISDDIIETFCILHEMGFAHSLETYENNQLVGGLYGVAIGGMFFGESMFHRATDASKVALVHLVNRMRDRNYALLDIQFITPHLRQFGARNIPRTKYLRLLNNALQRDCQFD
jgi:leucyl/phenylalanyl-tRNA--protein transferase